ncbi:MAG: AAA family ATPase [Geodermatophilaceae bacterium]
MDVRTAWARPTGVEELDRVLGGGLVPGAVVLLAGEPGVGKSTLLLEVAARVAAAGRPAGADRLRRGVRRRRSGCGPSAPVHCTSGCSSPRRPTSARSWRTSTRCGPACSSSTRCRRSPRPPRTARAGGVTQVRAVTAALIAAAKERGIATVLVGHVTKDGAIAGPRLLEHLVDVVLSLRG